MQAPGGTNPAKRSGMNVERVTHDEVLVQRLETACWEVIAGFVPTGAEGDLRFALRIALEKALSHPDR